MKRGVAIGMLLSLMALAAPSSEPLPPDIPTGVGAYEAELTGTKHDVYTYRPDGYEPAKSPLVMVFHGTGDTAEKYRGHAQTVGDRLKALIAAPRLPPKLFPLPAYHQGNLLDKDGKVTPRKDWTWELVPPLADDLRRRGGRPDQPLFLIGHSAGGQFLVRLAAFTDFPTARIVAANPGTHIFPTRDLPYPYGFGGLPDDLSNDAALRRFLARPLTFFQGTADTGKDALFDVSPTALKQGATRIERGRNAYAAGKKLADANGWPFRWRLVEAPGVGHSAARMFAHPNCDEAMAAK